MTRPWPLISRRSLAATTVLTLAGCASLFVATPPGKLYRLSPSSNYPPHLPHVKATLVIDRPQAAPGIDTSRIALSKSPISLDYYADAEWTDPLPDLMQNLLLASFENSGTIIAIDRGSAGPQANFILRTEIQHFEADYGAAGTPPRVWVAFIARLIAMPQRTIIAQTRFEQQVAATANTVTAVVTAFNMATAAVLRNIVVWTLANPALSEPRR